MAAEVFPVCDNRLAEFGQREPASLICVETVPQFFAAKGSQFVVDARHGWPRTVRQLIKEVAVLPFIEDARL